MKYETLTDEDYVEVSQEALRNIERDHLRLTRDRDRLVAQGADTEELDERLAALETQHEDCRQTAAAGSSKGSTRKGSTKR